MSPTLRQKSGSHGYSSQDSDWGPLESAKSDESGIWVEQNNEATKRNHSAVRHNQSQNGRHQKKLLSVSSETELYHSAKTPSSSSFDLVSGMAGEGEGGEDEDDDDDEVDEKEPLAGRDREGRERTKVLRRAVRRQIEVGRSEATEVTHHFIVVSPLFCFSYRWL